MARPTEAQHGQLVSSSTGARELDAGAGLTVSETAFGGTEMVAITRRPTR